MLEYIKCLYVLLINFSLITIGKQNFIFMFFILFIILLTGLYQTFSLFTSSEGMDIVDGIIELLDFGHIVDKVREVERLQRLRHRVFNHADCSSGIYYKDIRFCH